MSQSQSDTLEHKTCPPPKYPLTDSQKAWLDSLPPFLRGPIEKEWRDKPPAPKPKPKSAPLPDPHADFKAFAEAVAVSVSQQWEGWTDCDESPLTIAYRAIDANKEKILSASKSVGGLARTIAWRAVREAYRRAHPRDRRKVKLIATKQIMIDGTSYPIEVYSTPKERKPREPRQPRNQAQFEDSVQGWEDSRLEANAETMSGWWEDISDALKWREISLQQVRELYISLLTDEEAVGIALRYALRAWHVLAQDTYKECGFPEIGYRLGVRTKAAQRIIARALIVLREALGLEKKIFYIERQGEKWFRRDAEAHPERFRRLLGGENLQPFRRAK